MIFKRNPCFALQYALEELKGDREIVMEAVQETCFGLEDASKELMGYREIVMESVKWNVEALQYASEELKGDGKVVMKAVKQRGEALRATGGGLTILVPFTYSGAAPGIMMCGTLCG